MFSLHWPRFSIGVSSIVLRSSVKETGMSSASLGEYRVKTDKMPGN